MNLASLITRAREKAPGFRIVDFALTFDAIKERGIPAFPALFVMPQAESATPNSLATGAHHQKTTWAWRAYLYVKSARQNLGEGSSDELGPLRDQLIDAWMGWQPEGADGTVEFAGGRVVGLSGGVLVWQDDFNVTSFYRKVS